MTVTFREAIKADVPAVVALLQDDVLGSGRETADLDTYFSAFEAMSAEPFNLLIVGDQNGIIVATYHLTFITGLTLSATRRAQIEGVRVASHLRGQGVGHHMLADVEARARAAGCDLLQLAMNTTRDDTKRFYESLGFRGTHTGFKKQL